MELSDVLDFDLPNPSFQPKQGRLMQKADADDGSEDRQGGGAGWDLQVEESKLAPVQSSSPEPGADAGKSKWYKPSTWGKGKQQNNAAGQNDGINEPTQVA